MFFQHLVQQLLPLRTGTGPQRVTIGLLVLVVRLLAIRSACGCFVCPSVKVFAVDEIEETFDHLVGESRV